MKKILLLIAFTFISFSQAQTLDDIAREYLQPRSTVEQLHKGLKKVKSYCEINKEDKCNKAIAAGYYLLSDRYYSVGHQVMDVDTALVKPIFLKAKEIYNKANGYAPISEFKDNQIYLLIDSKKKLESDPKYKELFSKN